MKRQLLTSQDTWDKGVLIVRVILLILGLFTRIVSIPLIINMIVVTFYLGEGKILTADQHPFLFILLFLIFLSVGGGKWSLDYLIFDRAKQK